VITTRDAYYSTEMCKAVGHALYRKQNGQIIAVSEVVAEGNKPTIAWLDLKFVGKVTEFVQAASYDEWYDSYFDEKYCEDRLVGAW